MHIAAFACLYVALMLALTMPSITLSIISFLFFGAAPAALLLWLAGSRTRRARQRWREEQAARQQNSVPAVRNEMLHHGDGQNTQ